RHVREPLREARAAAAEEELLEGDEAARERRVERSRLGARRASGTGVVTREERDRAPGHAAREERAGDGGERGPREARPLVGDQEPRARSGAGARERRDALLVVRRQAPLEGRALRPYRDEARGARPGGDGRAERGADAPDPDRD